MSTNIEKLKKYVRALNYLSTTQIFLKDNFLLKDKLAFEHIKPRLLGHWGTCPGINFVYAHVNELITRTGADMMFLLGPGHGFPAIQANLFLEGTLGKYYKEATVDEKGIGYISRNFSWPYGFPSHSNPGAPGVILEGGELGYSLSNAYGAVLDNKDLIAVCLVGDGEQETGPASTAWHLSKFVDPKINGAVLPILHLNGYKISGPTVFGRMSNTDLKNLFRGYGYEPYIVEGANDKVYEKMYETLNTCYESIRNIQKEIRNFDKPREYFPRFPMIILKTPKGWTGIKKLGGNKIEGNCLAHQVVATEANTDKEQLRAVEKWLKSYKFEELFSKESGFHQDILDIVPKDGLKMGENKHTFGMNEHNKELVLPDVSPFTKNIKRGENAGSSMKDIGAYMAEVFAKNSGYGNFRIMSPDETYSNKFDAVFKTTSRAFAGKIMEWDKDLDPEGRVMEMLSEHSLQGMLQGYILTGRYGVLVSYEAFIQIVGSMADQFAKFMKVSREFSWRKPVPSLNYILTSSGWHQEHNGFSHQNPGFIDDMLQRHNNFTSVFLPPDQNTALVVLKRVLGSKNEINVIMAEKSDEPLWLTKEEAEKELKDGLAVWDFASDEDPHIVLSSAGQSPTKEMMASLDIVKKETPEVRVRFVNILELSPNTVGSSTGKMSVEKFEEYFTKDKPVIFGFHGYPETLKQSIFDYVNSRGRFVVRGYTETGSTTTSFDLHIRNRTSRFHIAILVWTKMMDAGVVTLEKGKRLISMYENKMKDHIEYIKKNGVDMPEIENWKWTR